MTHIMSDIETLGVRPGYVVLSAAIRATREFVLMDPRALVGETRRVGESQGYRALPVRDEIITCAVNGPGTNCIVSEWVPTPAELAALNNGAVVQVGILGTVPPPFYVGTTVVPYAKG